MHRRQRRSKDHEERKISLSELERQLSAAEEVTEKVKSHASGAEAELRAGQLCRS